LNAQSSDATAEFGVRIEEAGVRRRRRGRRLVRWFATLALVLAAAGVVVVVANPFGGGGPKKAGVSDNGAATSLATVTEGSLASQTQVSGTLGYAGSYSVVNNATGAATWLPGSGQLVRRGQVLYRVAGEPVVLLYGSTPAYRLLKYGMTGADVQQLNANLVVLGYASSAALEPTSDYFSAETKYALELLQQALGVKQTGTLALGQAVFLPGALRITHVMATLGTTLQPGAIVAQATSTRRQVTVNLDAAQQSSVKDGDTVTITLPNGSTTPGVVLGVGKVAGSGSSGSSTVPLYIMLKHPRAAGSLDQAPVQVQITTARVTHALVVPVAALLALAGGGYAVETVDARAVRHLVAVTAGLFDDAHGLVQVSGSLSAGEQVVVPST
jgi:hypothetical protein